VVVKRNATTDALANAGLTARKYSTKVTETEERVDDD
jgi:hypothetical protein